MRKEIEAILDEYIIKYKTPDEGNNFEDAMFLEVDICEKYGIKSVPDVQNIFSSYRDSLDKETFFRDIEKYAESYLLSTPDTPYELLEKAVANKMDYQDVLPEFGFSYHIYLIYIYNEFLLSEKDSIEHVLEEFELIKKLEDKEVLNDIGIITFGKISPKEHPLYSKLKGYKLKYLDHYFQIPS